MSDHNPLLLQLTNTRPVVPLEVGMGGCAGWVWIGDVDRLAAFSRGLGEIPDAISRNDWLHGSSPLSGGGCRGICWSLLRHSPERSLDAVHYSIRQHVRPLVYRLVRDANCFGGGGDGPTQQFDGFGFEHAELNHSSINAVNLGSTKRT